MNYMSETSVSKTMRWRVLAVLVVVYIFNHLDRSIITILQEPLKREFGISDTQLGLLSGFSFALLYTIASIPIARIADRGWTPEVIAISFALFSAMTLGSGLAPTFIVLLLMRIGVGIGEGGGVPPATAMIAGVFPVRERGLAMGIYALGPPVGVMLGIITGGLISQMLNWRAAFMIIGGAGVLLSPLVYVIVKRAAKDLLPKPAPAVQVNLGQALRELWRARAFRNIVLGGVFQNCANLSMVTWAPSFYMRVHDLSAGSVGVQLGVMLGVGGALGVLSGGALADALARRDQRWFVWLPALASALIIPVAWLQYLVPSVGLSLLLALVANFLVYTVTGPYFASIQSLARPVLRATALAVQGFVVVLIAIGLGPMIVGMASDALAARGVQDTLRYVLPAICLLNIFAVFFFVRAGATYVRECPELAEPPGMGAMR